MKDNDQLFSFITLNLTTSVYNVCLRYATKYAAKSGKFTELMNDIIDFLTRRSIDVLPPNTKQTLSQLVLADCSHRAFMTKQELSYKVMDLPPVRRSFAEVAVVGFYNRANLTVTGDDDKTITYSDRTEYSAYAERCRANVESKKFTAEELERMNFREFCERVNHNWKTDQPLAAEDIDPRTSYKVKTRDVNSGHWEFRCRQKRRHVRFSTVLYTDLAHKYQLNDPEDESTQTSFFRYYQSVMLHKCITVQLFSLILP